MHTRHVHGHIRTCVFSRKRTYMYVVALDDRSCVCAALRVEFLTQAEWDKELPDLLDDLTPSDGPNAGRASPPTPIPPQIHPPNSPPKFTPQIHPPNSPTLFTTPPLPATLTRPLTRPLNTPPEHAP